MEIHFGFSYTGLVFLAMLMAPNLIWCRHQPKDYGRCAQKESRLLLAFERVGEVSVTCLLLIIRDFNFQGFTPRALLFLLALLLMLLYEAYWVRYFKSEKSMADFYAPLWGIPVPGAVLPVAAALSLSIYGRNIFLFGAALCLGIGHIGIHMAHWKEVKTEHDLFG